MKFNTKFLYAGLTAICLIATACPSDAKKPEDAKKTDAKKEDVKKAEAKPEDKADTKPEDKPAAGGAEKIGVAECDEYIEKYGACLEKMSGPAGDASKKAFADMASAWKEAAKGPGKDALAQGCKAALDAAIQASKSTPGMEDCFK